MTELQLSLAKARRDAAGSEWIQARRADRLSTWICAVIDEWDGLRATGVGETPADAEACGHELADLESDQLRAMSIACAARARMVAGEAARLLG
jgi:hypothetical protein